MLSSLVSLVIHKSDSFFALLTKCPILELLLGIFFIVFVALNEAKISINVTIY